MPGAIACSALHAASEHMSLQPCLGMRCRAPSETGTAIVTLYPVPKRAAAAGCWPPDGGAHGAQRTGRGGSRRHTSFCWHARGAVLTRHQARSFQSSLASPQPAPASSFVLSDDMQPACPERQTSEPCSMQAPGVTVRNAAAHRDYIATLAENPAESLVLVARLQPAGEQMRAPSIAHSRCHA
jgi:hypothetical protein